MYLFFPVVLGIWTPGFPPGMRALPAPLSFCLGLLLPKLSSGPVTRILAEFVKVQMLGPTRRIKIQNIVLARKGAPAFNRGPGEAEAEAGGSEFKANLVYKACSGQLRLCRETLFQKINQNSVVPSTEVSTGDFSGIPKLKPISIERKKNAHSLNIFTLKHCSLD